MGGGSFLLAALFLREVSNMALGINDIETARQRIEPYVLKTPLLRLENLDDCLGCRVFAKAECMQKTGSFKLRGAMNKMLSLPREQIEKGIVAVSSGNHGRAVAYAAKLFGLQATIIIPDNAARVKVEAIRELGANIIQCKAEDRFPLAEQICNERGLTMVPPYDDHEIMAGQGTCGLEIMEQCPDMDTVLVPVSGGGLLSGVSCAIKAVSSNTRVFGICPEVLPHFKLSFEKGEPVAVPQRTSIADALASRQPGKKTFPVIKQFCDGILAVSEESIIAGMKLMLTEGKVLAEAASCICAGALLMGKVPVRENDRVCLLLSGGNVGLEQLEILK